MKYKVQPLVEKKANRLVTESGMQILQVELMNITMLLRVYTVQCYYINRG